MIGQAAVLGALIGVMNEARSDAPLAYRHGERLRRQVLVGLRTHGPVDHPSRIQIQEHRHIEPAGSRQDVGAIPDPHAIQRRSHKALPQNIGSGGRELMVFDDDQEPTDAPDFEPRPSDLGPRPSRPSRLSQSSAIAAEASMDIAGWARREPTGGMYCLTRREEGERSPNLLIGRLLEESR